MKQNNSIIEEIKIQERHESMRDNLIKTYSCPSCASIYN